MPNQPDPVLSTTIGHYRVESRISSGGFGVVYRVTRDGKAFALKLPLMDDPFEYHADRRVLEQRIAREVVSLMTLKHPNIVRIHAFDRWPEAETGALYLVMDFVPGVPLLQWRDEATPTVRDVVLAFHALALALDEMHRLGVVHRDLKSSNVLVAREAEPCFPSRWRPVIVDFGLARPAFTHDVTREHALLGTEGLWAPEQLQVALQLPDEKGQPIDPRSRFSAASDLHALGLLFYEALTGRRAFTRRDGRLAAVLAVPLAPSALVPSLPEFLDAPVMRLLAKDPAARHPNGAALADELEVLLARKQPKWDFALSPADATADASFQGTVEARGQQPTPIRHLLPRSFLDTPSPVLPLFARQSDAGAAPVTEVESRTLEVSRVRPMSVPAPVVPRTMRWNPKRAIRLVGAVSLALSLGSGLGGAIHSVVLAQRPSTSAPHQTAHLIANEPRALHPAVTQPTVAIAEFVPPAAPVPRVAPAPPVITASRPSVRTPSFARVSLNGRVQPGTTEVTLLEPVRVDGRLTLPPRTVIVGKAQEFGDGYRLSFDRARLPTGAVVPVRGSANADAAAGRRQPLRAGAAPVRLELIASFEGPAGP